MLGAISSALMIFCFPKAIHQVQQTQTGWSKFQKANTQRKDKERSVCKMKVTEGTIDHALRIVAGPVLIGLDS